jgi:hypothetical protein
MVTVTVVGGDTANTITLKKAAAGYSAFSFLTELAMKLSGGRYMDSGRSNRCLLRVRTRTCPRSSSPWQQLSELFRDRPAILKRLRGRDSADRCDSFGKV